MDREMIKNFLSTQKLMVVSTISDNNPQSALVAFVHDEELCLYFQTKISSRKTHNLSKNSNASVVIGLIEQDSATLQYEGEAIKVSNKNEIDKIKQMFINKKSPTVPYLGSPDQTYFRIEPTWIKYIRYYSEKHPEIVEINHF